MTADRNKVIACAMLTRCISADEMLYPTVKDVEQYLELHCTAEFFSATAKPDAATILGLIQRIWDAYAL